MDQQPIRLGVNIDHVASIRQARGTAYPEPLHAALMAEQTGADSITVHLREDRRHIQERDLRLLVELVQTRVNLEMAATDEMLEMALRYRPADCCLVPERREELTTEGGLDVVGQETHLLQYCRRLAEAGIRVALFVDPEEAQIAAAARVGAHAVELHTGAYADAGGSQTELKKLHHAASRADAMGLAVHAGHGLHYRNVAPVAAIAQISELNIGHALIARAVFAGLGSAIQEMKRLIQAARRQ